MEKNNWIEIGDVRCENNNIKVSFSVSDGLKKYFKDSGYILSMDFDIPVGSVPESIAVIPLVCCVLPVVWLSDATLKVRDIDMDFYNSIEKFKRGYVEMYPMLDFVGEVVCGKLSRNEKKGNKTVCLFSGGVDAYATMLNHLQECPDLLYLLGSDTRLSDSEGWNNSRMLLDDVSEIFSLNYHSVFSNFREILDEGRLEELIRGSGDGWWHGFQHGIGLISHAAPLAFLLGYGSVQIASSYTIREKGAVTCASDPTIDNYVSFCGASVHHDLYEMNRQDKVEFIVREIKRLKKKITLHVCWISEGGRNCCVCEKCYRTMAALMVAGENPDEYGFDVDESVFPKIKRFIFSDYEMPHHIIPLWQDIQSSCIRNWAGGMIPKRLKWLKKFDFTNVNDTLYKRLRRMKHRFVR